MKRLMQSLVLIVLAAPAFSGLFLNDGPTLFFSVTATRVGYLLALNLAIFILRGRFLWLTASVIAVAVTIPVVGGGGLLALILYAFNWGGMTLTQIASHYAVLLINMLSVIPLGIALVSLVPAAALEARLMRNTAGINLPQKILLMAMRVFNHVVFAVMHEVMQAALEELRFNNYLYKARLIGKKRRRRFLKNLLQKFMFMALTALCLSLKYIHFWTAEISALPGKRQKTRDVRLLFKTGVITAFMALAFLGTMLVKIPIPATGGYFNLGDTFVMLAGLLFGPLAGLLTGLVGPTVADLIGFPQFVPATAITKGLEGFMVGLIAFKSPKTALKIIALIVGVIILVSGYFIFEALIYPLIGQTVPFFAVTDLRAAFLEILPNTIQGITSAFLAIFIWRLLKKSLPKTQN